MADVGTALVTALGGGGFAAVWQGAKWFSEERARRSAEKAAAVRAPLQQKSLELRIAEQAQEIQQETIGGLRQSLADLRAEFTEYKQQARDERKRDQDKIRRQDERLKQQDAEIQRLYATIARMQMGNPAGP